MCTRNDASRNRLPKEEAVWEWVVQVEREDVLARAVRASLDVRDDRGDASDLGLAHDPPAELRVDDAQMAQLRASSQPTGAVEERESRRRPASAGRAIDLAVREDGHVALGQGIVVLLLPENHTVDVAQLGLERVHDLLPLL